MLGIGLLESTLKGLGGQIANWGAGWILGFLDFPGSAGIGGRSAFGASGGIARNSKVFAGIVPGLAGIAWDWLAGVYSGEV